MTFTFSDTDKTVQGFLNSIGVKYAFNYVGAADSKEWAHDLFTVSFAATGKAPITTEYKTGTGHRIDIAKKGKFTLTQSGEFKKHAELLGESITAVRFGVGANKGFGFSLYVPAPTAASVLFSLLLDMHCGADTFADFCANCGYDEDSRKAHEIYLACQQSGAKLRKVFTSEQITHLQDLLQDY